MFFPSLLYCTKYYHFFPFLDYLKNLLEDSGDYRNTQGKNFFFFKVKTFVVLYIVEVFILCFIWTEKLKQNSVLFIRSLFFFSKGYFGQVKIELDKVVPWSWMWVIDNLGTSVAQGELAMGASRLRVTQHAGSGSSILLC